MALKLKKDKSQDQEEEWIVLRVILGVMVLALPASANDWAKLDDNGIISALTARTVQYETATQDFRASGKTLYDAGSPSWGNWRASNDQYCSEWPPTGGWTCYDLERSTDGLRVRFVDANGGATVGRYIDLN